MLTEERGKLGAEVFFLFREHLVIVLGEDETVRLGHAAVDFEQFAIQHSRSRDHLLPNDRLVIGEQQLQELVIVGCDDRVRLDRPQRVDFWRQRVISQARYSSRGDRLEMLGNLVLDVCLRRNVTREHALRELVFALAPRPFLVEPRKLLSNEQG